MIRVLYDIGLGATLEDANWLKVEDKDNELTITGLVVELSSSNDGSLLYIEMSLDNAIVELRNALKYGYADLRNYPAILSQADGCTFSISDINKFNKIKEGAKVHV